MTSILNNFSIGKHQQTTQKEPEYRNKGFFRAQYASSIVSIPKTVISGAVLKLMTKSSEISNEDTAQLIKSARKGLRDSGLYEKGTRIIRMKEVPKEEVNNHIKNAAAKLLKKDYKGAVAEAQALQKAIKFTKKDHRAANAIGKEASKKLQKSPLMKLFTKMTEKNESIPNIKTMIESRSKTSGKLDSIIFKLGKNTCFTPEANRVIIPDKHLQTLVFHEMGHALNANGGVVLKTLQKMRPIAKILPAYILLISLLNKRKATDSAKADDSKLQKGKDFIKKNAGKLTFLSMLPMVSEEAIASLRGQQIAKKLVESGDLSKELFKKIKLANLCSFSTYILSALTMVATAKVAIKIKDSIQEKYEAKKLAKFEARNKN